MSAAPVTGARAWAGTALLAVAVLTGATTLRTLVGPGPWTLLVVGAVVLVAAVTATVRSLGRTRWAPTLWGLAVAAGLVAALWSAPSGPTLPLPTLGTLRGLRRTAESGIDAVVNGHIPVEPTAGITMLVVSGALVVLLVADLLALGLRRPGAAGIALAALWVTAVVFERRLPVLALLLGGTTFLMLLALVRPGRSTVRDEPSRRGAATAGVAAGLTALALATAPLLTVVPGWGAVRLPTTWGSTPAAGPVRLSLDLDMRASLGNQSGRTLLTYTTDGPVPGPLRMYTLATFDGRQWQRDGGDVAGADQDVDGVLWPEPVAEPVPEDVSTMQVRVGDLDGDRLPLPLDPRSLTLPPGAAWRYDPTRDEVLSRSASVRGLVYEVEVAGRDLSAEALQADTPVDAERGAAYLTVPDTPSAAEVRALAEEVTAGSGTAHEQAVALQSWFRDTRRFAYDTRVPAARSEDAVWDFLTDRRGYCVQYATAMTVMARHLGIPARMGVGFLPGRTTSSGDRVVTGRLAHTWPELWFADSGWVRFEPTPAVQTGAPPVYADPFAFDPVAPDEAEPTAPSATPTPTPTATPRAPSTTPGGEVTLGAAEVPRLLVVAVAGVLVVAVLVVRRRRAPRPPTDAEAAWEQLRRRLARAGVTWTDASTPRTTATELSERLGPGAPHEAHAALTALAGAVESQRYAPTPTRPDAEQLGAWVESVADAFAARRDASREDPVAERVGA